MTFDQDVAGFDFEVAKVLGGVVEPEHGHDVAGVPRVAHGGGGADVQGLGTQAQELFLRLHGGAGQGEHGEDLRALFQQLFKDGLLVQHDAVVAREFIHGAAHGSDANRLVAHRSPLQGLFR